MRNVEQDLGLPACQMMVRLSVYLEEGGVMVIDLFDPKAGWVEQVSRRASRQTERLYAGSLQWAFVLRGKPSDDPTAFSDQIIVLHRVSRLHIIPDRYFGKGDH